MVTKCVITNRLNLEIGESGYRTMAVIDELINVFYTKATQWNAKFCGET